MRKLVAAVVGVVVLAAAGFATASVVKSPGKGHAGSSTSGSTTGTLPTQTGTTGGRKVTICHKTGSKTNPGVTITVSQNALDAHMAHGDQLGPCPTKAGDVEGDDDDKAKHDKKKHKAGHHAKPKHSKAEHAQKGKPEHAAKSKHHASTSHATGHGKHAHKPHGHSQPTTQPVHGNSSGDHGNGGHGKGK